MRIWARPFSGANFSPGYAAHGSPIYPIGSGGGTGSFTLTAGPMVVDKVRIQMWNADQTQLLFEAFLPVHLLWAGAGPPPGPDMSLNAIEVTQAIQDLNNSVELVAGKRTYVRVHAGSPVNTADVFATLSGKHGLVNLNPVLNPGNPGSDITVRTSSRPRPDQRQLLVRAALQLDDRRQPDPDRQAGSQQRQERPGSGEQHPHRDGELPQHPAAAAPIVNVQYTIGGTTYLERQFI